MAGQIFIPLKAIFDDAGIRQAQKSFGGLGRSLKGTLGALGLGIGISKLVSELKQAGKEAVADVKSQALLAQQLKNTAGANDSAIASAEKFINKLQLQTSILDDNLRPAFAKLVRATGDVSKAQDLLALSTDVAAGTGKDLGMVATAVGKAVNGQTSSLTRLGIVLKEGQDPVKVLKEQFAGMAATAANLDPYQRMQVIFSDIQEQIGMALIPTLQSFANYLASPEGQGKIAIFVEQVKQGVIWLTQLADWLAENINWLGPFAVAIGVATVAIKLMNIALNANPYVLTATALIGIAYGISQIGKNADDANGSVDNLRRSLLKTALASKKVGDAARAAYIKATEVAGLPSKFNTDSASAIANAVKNFKAPKAKSDIQKLLDGLTKTKKSGNSTTPKKVAKDAIATTKAVADTASAAAEELKALRKEFAKSIREGFAGLLKKETPALGEFQQQVVDSFTAIKQTIMDADKRVLSNRKKAIFLGLAEFAQQQLSKIAKQRDELATKIANAKSFMESVKDSIFGQVNITSMGRSAEAIIGNFKKIIQNSLDFKKNIKALSEAGLGQDAIQQIIQAGAEVGGATAKALIKGGPAAISQVNDLFGQLTDVASGVSEVAGQAMFGSGVDLSNGLISGLLSQEEQLRVAADTLAKAFQDQFNSRLKLGKADTSFINVGGTTAQGTVVNLTVNAPMGTGNSIGKLIIDEISKFEKTSGMVFARA